MTDEPTFAFLGDQSIDAEIAVVSAVAQARQRLEGALNDLLASHGWQPNRTTEMGLRFAVADSLATAQCDPGTSVVAQAERSWSMLADICHFDERFEMPSRATARHLVRRGFRAAIELDRLTSDIIEAAASLRTDHGRLVS